MHLPPSELASVSGPATSWTPARRSRELLDQGRRRAGRGRPRRPPPRVGPSSWLMASGMARGASRASCSPAGGQTSRRRRERSGLGCRGRDLEPPPHRGGANFVDARPPAGVRGLLGVGGGRAAGVAHPPLACVGSRLSVDGRSEARSRDQSSVNFRLATLRYAPTPSSNASNPAAASGNAGTG